MDFLRNEITKNMLYDECARLDLKVIGTRRSSP